MKTNLENRIQEALRRLSPLQLEKRYELAASFDCHVLSDHRIYHLLPASGRVGVIKQNWISGQNELAESRFVELFKNLSPQRALEFIDQLPSDLQQRIVQNAELRRYLPPEWILKMLASGIRLKLSHDHGVLLSEMGTVALEISSAVKRTKLLEELLPKDQLRDPSILPALTPERQVEIMIRGWGTEPEALNDVQVERLTTVAYQIKDDEERSHLLSGLLPEDLLRHPAILQTLTIDKRLRVIASELVEAVGLRRDHLVNQLVIEGSRVAGAKERTQILDNLLPVELLGRPEILSLLTHSRQVEIIASQISLNSAEENDPFVRQLAEVVAQIDSGDIRTQLLERLLPERILQVPRIRRLLHQTSQLKLLRCEFLRSPPLQRSQIQSVFEDNNESFSLNARSKLLMECVPVPLIEDHYVLGLLNEADRAIVIREGLEQACAQGQRDRVKNLYEWRLKTPQEWLEMEANLSTEAIQWIEKERNRLLTPPPRRYFEWSRSFSDNFLPWVTREEFETEAKKYVRRWCDENLEKRPDDQQLEIIRTPHKHVQVVARAGSGKTGTLINRAHFLIHQCGVKASEILLLAFNRKAAKEIRDRLNSALPGGAIPHVMTFHALASRLVHPEEAVLYDDEREEHFEKSRTVQFDITECLKDPHFANRVRELILLHWGENEWNALTGGGLHLTNKERVDLRRSLSKTTLRGESVKSAGEKRIANCLFEYGVRYKYEHNFYWGERNYHPDFTIFTGKNSGVVIEYFGLAGDPDYDAERLEKRKFWEGKNEEWVMFEYEPRDLTDKFEERLIRELGNAGVVAKKLSEDEIWKQIRERAITHFTRAMVQFIGRCRKSRWTTDELLYRTGHHEPEDRAEELFLGLAGEIYQIYLSRLQATGEDDFDGLLQKAADAVCDGQNQWAGKNSKGDVSSLRFLWIDEFQDFSELFNELIQSISRRNPKLSVLAVGDDWQAINGFAGSDLKFFKSFEHYFPDAQQLEITTNYRSVRGIVEAGNKVMLSKGTPAEVSCNREQGMIGWLDLATFKPDNRESLLFEGDLFLPAILRIIHRFTANESRVALLFRTNRVPWPTTISNPTLENFWKELEKWLPKDVHERVTVATVHQFKGLDRATVVLCDTTARSYPLIHSDLKFSRIFGDSLDSIVEAERRLFYVGVTRAIERLILVSEAEITSPFLNPLNLEKIDVTSWVVPPGDGADWLVVVSGNTKSIKDHLKAADYQWSSRSRSWCKFMSRKLFEGKSKEAIEASLKKSLWGSHAKGVFVQLEDSLGQVQYRLSL